MQQMMNFWLESNAQRMMMNMQTEVN